jgi:hypothetical protein
MPETQQPRAVGISLSVGEGVVLAMHGDPLTPTLAGGEPEQSTATRVRDRIQSLRAMRKPAVEIDGRGDDGDLGQRQGDQRDDPPVMWHRVLRAEIYWPRIETAPLRAVRLLAARAATMLTSVRASTGFAT